MKSWRITTRASSLICGRGACGYSSYPCCGEDMEKTGQGEQGPFMDCSLSFPLPRTHLSEASHLGHLLTIACTVELI